MENQSYHVMNYVCGGLMLAGFAYLAWAFSGIAKDLIHAKHTKRETPSNLENSVEKKSENAHR